MQLVWKGIIICCVKQAWFQTHFFIWLMTILISFCRDRAIWCCAKPIQIPQLRNDKLALHLFPLVPPACQPSEFPGNSQYSVYEGICNILKSPITRLQSKLYARNNYVYLICTSKPIHDIGNGWMLLLEGRIVTEHFLCFLPGKFLTWCAVGNTKAPFQD